MSSENPEGTSGSPAQSSVGGQSSTDGHRSAEHPVHRLTVVDVSTARSTARPIVPAIQAHLRMTAPTAVRVIAPAPIAVQPAVNQPMTKSSVTASGTGDSLSAAGSNVPVATVVRAFSGHPATPGQSRQQVFPAHLPRGAAAAAAITTPKPAITSAILRPSQSMVMPLGVSMQPRSSLIAIAKPAATSTGIRNNTSSQQLDFPRPHLAAVTSAGTVYAGSLHTSSRVLEASAVRATVVAPPLSHTKPVPQPVTPQMLPHQQPQQQQQQQQQHPINMSMYQHGIYPGAAAAPPVAHSKVAAAPLPAIAHQLQGQFMVAPPYAAQKATLVRARTPPPSRAHASMPGAAMARPPRSPPPHQSRPPPVQQVQAVPPQHVAPPRNHSPTAKQLLHPRPMKPASTQQRAPPAKPKSPPSAALAHTPPPKQQQQQQQTMLMQATAGAGGGVRLAAAGHHAGATAFPHLLSSHVSHPSMHALPVTHAREIREQQHKVAAAVASSPQQQITSKPATITTFSLSSTQSHPTMATTITSIPVAKVYPQQVQTTSAGWQQGEGPARVLTDSNVEISQPPVYMAGTQRSTTIMSVSDNRPQEIRTSSLATSHFTTIPAGAAAYYYNAVGPQIPAYSTAAHSYAAPASAGLRTTISSCTPVSSHPTSSISSSVQTAALQVSAGVPLRLTQPMLIEPTGQPPRQGYVTVTEPTFVSADATDRLSGVADTITVRTTLPNGQTLEPPLPNNSTTSPRPSILRKRPTDGTPVKRQLCMTPGGSESNSPMQESRGFVAGSSIKASLFMEPTEVREGSHSSTESADSNELQSQISDFSSISTTEMKQETQDWLDSSQMSGMALVAAVAVSTSACHSVEASPRKKPRKQLLAANEEFVDPEVAEEEERDRQRKELERQLERLKEQAVKDEGRLQQVRTPSCEKELEEKRYVAYPKRSASLTLLSTYRPAWKACHNHFLRHSDVRVKDDRRPTVNELANQRNMLQRTHGWKLHHLTTQLDEMTDAEEEVLKRLSSVQEGLSCKTKPGFSGDELSIVLEIVKGNVQRSKIAKDQLLEAKAMMMKLLDHKPQVQDIIQKHISKRTVKKKERT